MWRRGSSTLILGSDTWFAGSLACRRYLCPWETISCCSVQVEMGFCCLSRLLPVECRSPRAGCQSKLRSGRAEPDSHNTDNSQQQGLGAE